MKNVLNFYYNLYPNQITNKDNDYYFYYDDEKYNLTIFLGNENSINYIYEMNKQMLKNGILINEIIVNNNYQVLTYIDNIPYILYKIIFNDRLNIKLSDISNLAKKPIKYHKELLRNNWVSLWETKIDYLEYQINQMGKKYPLLVDSFNYYVGWAENAISYIRNTITEVPQGFLDEPVLAHSYIKLGNNTTNFYDPTNIIIDHKSRDLAEYIKQSFFESNDIYTQLDEYFNHNYYSIYAMRLLMGRLLYPSFYFNLYDQVIIDQTKEPLILELVTTTTKYEEYISDIYFYLKKYYNLPQIEWLIPR